MLSGVISNSGSQPFSFTKVCVFSQHAILAKKFVEVMTKYNEAQMDFRDKSKGRIARQLEISEFSLFQDITGLYFIDDDTTEHVSVTCLSQIKPSVDPVFNHDFSAGKATTDEELEEMLEGGNAAVFTAGVRTSS